MQIRTYTVGPMDNNTYVMVDDRASRCVVVDTGLGADEVVAVLKADGLVPDMVLSTHAHLDHVVCNALFARGFGCEVALHPDDLDLLHALPAQAEWFGVETPEIVEPTVTLADEMELQVGDDTVRVVHSPGHSPGHVCLEGDGWVIVGDVIFAGSIGRTDLPGGDYATLMRSIERCILRHPDDTVLYPGHGPRTTVGAERRGNPFLLEGGRQLWT